MKEIKEENSMGKKEDSITGTKPRALQHRMGCCLRHYNKP